ncbi:hypothetical protein [Nocardia neocaledoniensis]|uniref:hypothetical protein n=1 Tax=Nocardia neocaledoniensis TaxID=236511 RepID=UPI0024589979|nr:hypothetical protein [Nocardia neocaledoniensis]
MAEFSSAVGAHSGWIVFWMQLPLLVVAVAIVLVTTIAVCRAKAEDVPKVLTVFANAFSIRSHRRGPAVAEPKPNTVVGEDCA